MSSSSALYSSRCILGIGVPGMGFSDCEVRRSGEPPVPSSPAIFSVPWLLAMAEAMPLPQFAVTSAVIASGFVVNFLNCFGWLHEGVWTLWEDFVTVGGLSVLPQVMWSTFVPFVPNSTLPGIVCCAVAFLAVVLARAGKLSEKGTKFVRSTSGWTATLLFMWMPVAQMWTNYLSPENIKGLSAFSMLLAMLGNGLLVPRALFTRDLMWFTGSSWGSFLHGWGNLLCMFMNDSLEGFNCLWIQFTNEIFDGINLLVMKVVLICEFLQLFSASGSQLITSYVNSWHLLAAFQGHTRIME